MSCDLRKVLFLLRKKYELCVYFYNVLVKELFENEVFES